MIIQDVLGNPHTNYISEKGDKMSWPTRFEGLTQWFSTCVPRHTSVPQLDAWCDLENFASFDI